MGGWKRKEEGGPKSSPSLLFLSLSCFYLSCLSVSVSRVCAPTLPLTNNTGSRPRLIKRGPLPDWPVWTRAQMEGSAAVRREDSSGEKNETAPLEESATALSPPIKPAISAEDLEDYEGRGNSPAIRQAMSATTITIARSTEPEPSLEEKITMIRVTMSAKAESRQRLDDSTPTTQAEFPPSGESAFNNGDGNEGPTAQPKISLFPHKKKKRAIKPLVLKDPTAQNDSLGLHGKNRPSSQCWHLR
jgi:hypothetical protein